MTMINLNTLSYRKIYKSLSSLSKLLRKYIKVKNGIPAFIKEIIINKNLFKYGP